MAKTKGKKKRYAVQRHMEITGMDSSDWNVLDLPKFLSESNHRLYRQSRVYKAKVNFLSAPVANNGLIHVYVLRDTWMLQKAYQMAKDAYDKNMSEERADISPTNMARWQDFRINLDPKSSGVTDLRPTVRATGTLGTSTLGNGEFIDTRVFKEDGTAMTFGLYGTSVRWSIVEEYDKTADVDSMPANQVSGSDINPYGALDDDNQQAARDDLQNRGNAPPYDPNSLDGAKLFRRVATLGVGAQSHKTSTGVFEAPLGIVVIVFEEPESVPHLELEVSTGDYKGVHGEKYIEDKKFSHRKG